MNAPSAGFTGRGLDLDQHLPGLWDRRFHLANRQHGCGVAVSIEDRCTHGGDLIIVRPVNQPAVDALSLSA